MLVLGNTMLKAKIASFRGLEGGSLRLVLYSALDSDADLSIISRLLILGIDNEWSQG